MKKTPRWAYTQLILVAGLPGSGKSMWCEPVARDTGALLIDDFKKNAPDLSFPNSLKLPLLVETLTAGRRCVVADVDFTRTEARLEAKRWLGMQFPEIRALWVFFANEPVQCRVNVEADETRNPKKRLFEIDARFSSYRIPSGSVVLPVWKGDG